MKRRSTLILMAVLCITCINTFAADRELKLTGKYLLIPIATDDAKN